jgi:PAS domain S-box-containing protein
VLTANLVCACLVAGLAIYVTLRRPPRTLWPVLPLFQVFVLLYLLGDAMTGVSRDLVSEQLGIAVLYSGSLPASVACWILAIRYAEAQGLPFRSLGAGWTRIPMAAAGLGWAAMITNPWHGHFLTPVIGAHNQPHWLWWLFVPAGYALVTGSIFLYAATARRARDPLVRRNARIMAGGILLTLVFNFISYVPTLPLPFDLTVVGLGAASALFLFGAYRTRLFSLLPVALAEVIRHDPDGFVVIDPDGFWLNSNPAASSLLGADLERPDTDVFALLAPKIRSGDGGELSRDELARALFEEPHSVEVELVGAGADSRWIRVAGTPIPSREKRVLAMALWILDISVARNTEKALRSARDELESRVAERTEELESAVEWLRNEMNARRKAEEGLRRSQERYRAISELSTDFGFAFQREADGKLSWEWVTQAALRIIGYEADELVDRNLRFLIHPDDLDLIETKVVAAVKQGESVNLEFRIRTKTGELRWLELRASTMVDETDGSVRMVGAVRDLTESKRADEERQKLERRVQETQRMESLGVLAGGVAHDFNNLLGVILGSASLASTELDEPEQLRHRLTRICAAVDYGAKLTDQLLNYAGGSPFSLQPLDLRQILLEMLDLLRASVPSKCGVRTELPDELPCIEADDTQIRQVIVNLVSNAGEALGDTGGDVTVRVGTVNMPAEAGAASDAGPEDVEWVFLEVEDPGPGMDEQTRRRIFEPFFSTKQTGRGLGLAAVHGIVGRHSGKIELDTTPGSGTRFRVLLPRAENSVSHATVASAPQPRALAREATVLLVDDDEAILELADEFLRRAGIQTVVALGGAEAIRIFEERAEEIDAVVLDWVMPEIGGEQVLQALRELRPTLRVVLVTGYREPPTQTLASSSERTPYYLRKPFEAADLVDCVRRALEAE